MDLKKVSEFLTPALWLVGGLMMLASLANAAPNPNFHIYIAYGQSNMAGNGEIVPSVDQATNPKNPGTTPVPIFKLIDGDPTP